MKTPEFYLQRCGCTRDASGCWIDAHGRRLSIDPVAARSAWLRHNLIGKTRTATIGHIIR